LDSGIDAKSSKVISEKTNLLEDHLYLWASTFADTRLYSEESIDKQHRHLGQTTMEQPPVKKRHKTKTIVTPPHISNWYGVLLSTTPFRFSFSFLFYLSALGAEFVEGYHTAT